MADLIGTASIRVDMGTAGAAGKIRRFANQAEGSFRGLQRRITQVQSQMQRLGPASIPVTLGDDTAAGNAAIRATIARMQGLGPVRIPVSVNDSTRRGARTVQTTVARLQRLGPIQISASVDVDAAATVAAAAALRDLQAAARGAARALGTLATRATAATAALVALGAAARSLRGDMDDLDGAIRRTGGGMTGLRGRLGTVTTAAGSAGGALDGLRSAALLLAPALLPIAAQAIHVLPLAANFGAAAVAVGVFGAAIAGQVVAIKDVAEAEKKAAEAVQTHGASSAEAAKAQDAYRAALSALPPATRTAAAAFSVLSDQYREWSDSLADNTMPVATKAFAAFGAVFPKLTPLVQGTSRELDRFVTIAAGGIQSPGFNRFMNSFSEFAEGALRRGNDALVRFMRTLDTGKVSGGFAQFMEYARANGPLVRDVLSNLAEALGNILEGAANVGPGLLVVVNALAGIVAAVPPGAITALLQLAIALKAVRLAAAGMAASSAGVAAFGVAITAMRVAAAGATGVLPRLGAAIATLSRTAKIAIAGTGIGLLVIALTELAEASSKAPVDVDRMTTALGEFGRTGRVAGELKANLGDLSTSIAMVSKSASDNKLATWTSDFGTWIGIAEGPGISKAKENVDAVDKSLANLVKNGQADLAAAAAERLQKAWVAGGGSVDRFKSTMNDYKASLADAKFEQQLAADAMGLFGQQALSTSEKLAEQKQSADGLRQAIHALNEAVLMARGGIRGMEAAIDAAAEAARENGRTLDENTEKGRANNQALDNLASSTMKAAEAARENGSSWATVNGIYDRGRGKLVESAMQMGLTRKEAKALADQILKTPDKTARLKGNLEDLKKKVGDAKREIKSVPESKRSELKGKLDDLQKKVKDAKAQIKSVPPSKRSELRATIGQLQDQVAAAKRELASVQSRTVTLTVRRNYAGVAAGTARSGLAAGGLVGYASGGAVRGYPHGGAVHGPGTATSDSIPAMLSRGEFVVNAKQTRQNLPLLKAINDGRTGMAGGGMFGAGAAVGDGLAAGMAGAMRMVESAARALAAVVDTSIRRELEISSPSKKLAKIGKQTGAGFIKGLTGTKAQINSTAKSIASAITAAFKGTRSRTDDRLVKMVASGNKRLQALSKQRDAVAKKIAAAQKFATDTAARARETGSLSSIIQPDYFAPSYVERDMKKSLGQIKAFTKNVQTLQKRGLSKGLLRQILELGPEQGAAFAKSLANTDTATIKRYNKLQSDLNKQSTKLGKVGSDMLFDSGKKAGQGFLTGLKAQQKQIEKLMLNIAKGMQKAIRRALGIKSPSTVFAAIGRNVGDGLAAGLSASGPKVAAAAKRLSSAAAVTAGKAAAGRRTGGAAEGAPKTGYGAAVAELQKLVDTGRWRKSGSMLFEDVSFQGMSKNFQRQQMKVADGFWAAVNEIKKAVKSGKKVFEDMTFKGMSGNVGRFHDMIAQVWKGNPYGRNFGDWGNFGAYGRYGKYAGGGLIRGPGSGTSDAVPVLASSGEFIVRAAAVRRYGVPHLQAINDLQVSASRGGGTATATAPAGDLHLHITNHGVISSERETLAWLTRSLDTLNQRGRLPRNLRRA
jgi:hypothetical protein